MEAVLVTTEYRGVFFGYMENGAEKTLPKKVTLKNVRNCMYWDTAVRGFVGLSTDGPNSKCRIGPQAESMTLYGITSVTPVTDGAMEKWEKAQWSG
jgi:hypothetical protein